MATWFTSALHKILWAMPRGLGWSVPQDIMPRITGWIYVRKFTLRFANMPNICLIFLSFALYFYNLSSLCLFCLHLPYTLLAKWLSTAQFPVRTVTRKVVKMPSRRMVRLHLLTKPLRVLCGGGREPWGADPQAAPRRSNVLSNLGILKQLSKRFRRRLKRLVVASSSDVKVSLIQKSLSTVPGGRSIQYLFIAA